MTKHLRAWKAYLECSYETGIDFLRSENTDETLSEKSDYSYEYGKRPRNAIAVEIPAIHDCFHSWETRKLVLFTEKLVSFFCDKKHLARKSLANV